VASGLLTTVFGSALSVELSRRFLTVEVRPK
jgi:hypothetical protein